MPFENDPFAPKIISQDGQPYLYSPLRKKHLRLTPEEWARQRTVNYLLKKMQYPKELIAEEKKLRNSRLRFDLLVYDKNLSPFLIIEVKAPYIKLSEKTLLQALAYTKSLGAPFLSLTNGTEILSYDLNTGSFSTNFPAYPQ